MWQSRSLVEWARKNIVIKTNQLKTKPLLPLHTYLTLYHSLILPLFDCSDYMGGQKQHSTDEQSLSTRKQGIKINFRQIKIFLRHQRAWGTRMEALRSHLHQCVFIFKCLHKIIDLSFNFRQNNAIYHHNACHNINSYWLKLELVIRYLRSKGVRNLVPYIWIYTEKQIK